MNMLICYDGNMIIFTWSWYLRNDKYVYVLCLETLNIILFYMLLCGKLSNPQWSFNWPPTHLYEWCRRRAWLIFYCLWVL